MRPIRAVEVCIAVVDRAPVTVFWCDLLGDRTADALDDSWVHREPPDGLPAVNLRRLPEPKVGKNRLHLDLFVDDPFD